MMKNIFFFAVFVVLLLLPFFDANKLVNGSLTLAEITSKAKYGIELYSKENNSNDLELRYFDEIFELKSENPPNEDFAVTQFCFGLIISVFLQAKSINHEIYQCVSMEFMTNPILLKCEKIYDETNFAKNCTEKQKLGIHKIIKNSNNLGESKTKDGINFFMISIFIVIILIVVGYIFYRIIQIIHDRREFARFEREQLRATFSADENPVYRQAQEVFRQANEATINDRR